MDSTRPPPTAPRSPERGRRFGWLSSVGLLVAALTALPMAGAAWFATAEIRRVGLAEDRATAVADQVSLLVEIMTLRTNVLEERNWVLVTDAIEQLGIAPAETLEVIGVDVPTELESARTDVDRALLALSDTELTAAVGEARDGLSATNYLSIDSTLDARSDGILREVLRSAGVVPGGGDLNDALRVLAAATDASQSVALQLTNYFAVVFPTTDNQQNKVDKIVSLDVLYSDAMSRVRRTAPVGSEARTAVSTIEASLDIVRFNFAIVRLINSAGTNEAGTPLSTDDLFSDSERTATAIKGGSASVDAHIALIRGAAVDVEHTTTMISETAQSDTRRSLIMISLLGLSSLIFVVAVTSILVAPLRSLANRAARIGDGLDADESRLRGPREIRAAGVAIRDAAANLALVERQAKALAEGELSHPVLDEAAPGTLGVTLQKAVRTLASSLAEREESQLATERAVLELRETQDQLVQAQKLESIGQLAAGVAHEINTPMQYLSDNTRFLSDSFTELLVHFDDLIEIGRRFDADAVDAYLASADLDFLRAEIPSAFEASQDGLNRVTEIVRAMKDFSHPGSELTETDLNRAISSTATVSRNEWKYVAELELDLDESLPHVRCHEGQFKQVMLNLIVNAAHAIGDSDQNQTKQIIVATRRAGEQAQIRVSDTGCGMPSDVQARIFDPFFTTKEVGRGTGQGLALVHRIITAHDGTIRVESVVGAGTTFVIEMPIGAELDHGQVAVS